MTGREASDEVRRRPVGVFDSGVGGLTVLHELLVQLPAEDFVYFADSARFPYGGRTQAELEAFALEVAEELLARRIKLLVVACNSATAAALPALRERLMQTTLGVDVLGVVQPGAVQAVAATRNGRVGCWPRRRRWRAASYAKAIADADPFVKLTSVACPDLAAIIEAGFPFDQQVVDTVRGLHARRCARRASTRSSSAARTTRSCARCSSACSAAAWNIIVSGDPLARQVEHVLGARGLANPRQTGEGELPFLCTGDTEAFRALGTRFLQLPLGEVAATTRAGAPRADGGAAMSPRAAAAARPTSCGRRRSSPASCAPPPARR